MVLLAAFGIFECLPGAETRTFRILFGGVLHCEQATKYVNRTTTSDVIGAHIRRHLLNRLGVPVSVVAYLDPYWYPLGLAAREMTFMCLRIVVRPV